LAKTQSTHTLLFLASHNTAQLLLSNCHHTSTTVQVTSDC